MNVYEIFRNVYYGRGYPIDCGLIRVTLKCSQFLQRDFSNVNLIRTSLCNPIQNISVEAPKLSCKNYILTEFPGNVTIKNTIISLLASSIPHHKDSFELKDSFIDAASFNNHRENHKG